MRLSDVVRPSRHGIYIYIIPRPPCRHHIRQHFMVVQLSLPHLSLAVALLVALRWLFSKKLHTLPLPPGPPRLPILGNALDMPKHDTHEAFRDMNAKYGGSYRSSRALARAHYCLIAGDVVYLEVLGQPIIVLGSHEAALDLFEKRSAIYSDRMPSVMVKL